MPQQTYHLGVETLTPVHIGSGRTLRRHFDYTIFDAERQLAVLDDRKVFDLVGRDELPRWLAMIEQGEDIVPYLRTRRPGLHATDISRRVAALNGAVPRENNELREQMLLGAPARPAIPGSSIKGAVKTAVLGTLIRKNPDFVQREENLTAGRRKEDRKDQQVVAHYFNQRLHKNKFGEQELSPNQDAFRFLRFPDLYFDRTAIVKTRMANMLRRGWVFDDARSPYVECIPAGTRSLASSSPRLNVPADAIRLVQQRGYMDKNLRFVSDPVYLFETINRHTAHLLEAERAFWEEEALDYTILDAYLEAVDTLLRTVKACGPKACILRLGYSSGWESMTGRWAKDKDAFGDFILNDRAWARVRAASRPGDRRYDEDTPFPKTRKLAGGVEPMGYIKIMLID